MKLAAVGAEPGGLGVAGLEDLQSAAGQGRGKNNLGTGDLRGQPFQSLLEGDGPVIAQHNLLRRMFHDPVPLSGSGVSMQF